MTRQSFKKAYLLIGLTAIALIASQTYFTLQNYEVNKQRFYTDVQEILNQSIDSYFTEKARNQIFIMSRSSTDSIGGKKIQSIAQRFDNVDSLLKQISDEDGVKSVFGLNQQWTGQSSYQTLHIDTDSILRLARDRDTTLELEHVDLIIDATQAKEFEVLTQKVVVSVNQDLLDLGQLYSIVDSALIDKGLQIDFMLHQEVMDRKTSIGSLDDVEILSAKASSPLLFRGHSIAIDFENATLLILRNGLSELFISVLLVGLVIGTIFHLYQTIQNQKQLATIKDDLISNITHEFKTPIATIFSALEGITSFNEANDQEKTKRYLALSNDQLKKLNHMVEKMLETAVIDQGKLALSPEELEVVSFTEAIVNRFAMVNEKNILFESDLSSRVTRVDRFHVENALSNLIDNAIKYGGDEISVTVRSTVSAVEWIVSDNGGNIPKAHQEQIFDKLYRIPTGNKHDVKGFGIGLYYARTIAQLHGGSLTLEATAHFTRFMLVI